jgi:hypothetical protein
VTRLLSTQVVGAVLGRALEGPQLVVPGRRLRGRRPLAPLGGPGRRCREALLDDSSPERSSQDTVASKTVAEPPKVPSTAPPSARRARPGRGSRPRGCADRPPEVDGPPQRLDRLALDEQLDGLERRLGRRDGVHQLLHRHRLEGGAATVRGRLDDRSTTAVVPSRCTDSSGCRPPTGSRSPGPPAQPRASGSRRRARRHRCPGRGAPPGRAGARAGRRRRRASTRSG